jgi:hypothetical protein
MNSYNCVLLIEAALKADWHSHYTYEGKFANRKWMLYIQVDFRLK